MVTGKHKEELLRLRRENARLREDNEKMLNRVDALLQCIADEDDESVEKLIKEVKL